MAIYFLRPTNGNDANDGLDFHGFGLTAATFTNATKNLSETNAFTSYTWNSGDTIYISGGTGVTTGLYSIASKTDASNIVLGADIGGTNPSDVTSSSGARKTFQQASNLMTVAGDVLRMCPEATETVSSQVSLVIASGTVTVPSRFEPGSTTTGALDLTAQYTLQGTAAMTYVLSVGTNDHYLIFVNLTVDGNTFGTTGAFHDSTGGRHTYQGCRFTGAAGSGFVGRNDGQRPSQRFYNCQFDNNTAYGYRANATGDGAVDLIQCKIHDNGDHGAYLREFECAVQGCLIFDNAGDGINMDGNSDGTVIERNTIYGNTGDGLDMASGANQIRIFGNSFAANGGYGVNGNGATKPILGWSHNHFYNNTSGDTDLTDLIYTGSDASGDPLFESVTDGAEDFRIKNGSPLYQAGAANAHIGALGVSFTAGGGGGVIALGKHGGKQG